MQFDENETAFTHVAEVPQLDEQEMELAKLEAIQVVHRMAKIARDRNRSAASIMRIMAASVGYVLLSMEANDREGNSPPCKSPCDPISLMNVAALVPMVYLSERERQGWEDPHHGPHISKPEGNA